MSTFRRLYLSFCRDGDEFKRIAVPVSGDIVADKDIHSGRVTVWCVGISPEAELPHDYSLVDDEPLRAAVHGARRPQPDEQEGAE